MTVSADMTYRLVRLDSGRPMGSDVAFDYVDPNLPTLRMLREQEGLDRIADEAASEFALIRGVMNHVKRQWDHSAHVPMQHVNALELLEDARSGLRGNFCVYFTHVLLQSLWSVGVPCRYTHVAVSHWHSHSTSECWSNEHRKWITVDSDFNLHYLRAEGAGPLRTWVPQNALDIQRAWRSGEIDHVVPVQELGELPYDADTRLGDLYGGVFGFIADYEGALRHGLPEWEGQSRRWCVWIDDADELGEEHLRQFWLTHGNGECTPIHDTAQYYWPVNEVVIERPAVDGFAGGTLGMGFETFTPWFDGFEVSADGGPWTAHAAAHVEGHRAEGEVAWALHPGRNVLEIRSRNTSGRVGPTALIEIASLSHVPPEGDGHWHVGGDVADPGGMAVRGGRLYAARPWSGRVDVLLDGEVVAEIGTAVPVPGHPLGPPIEPLHEAANIRRAADAPRGHLMSPMACVVGTDGTVFVADSENYRVQPFDADGRALDPWGEHGVEDGQFLHIRALAAGDDGSVYVADSGYCGAVGLRTEHLSRVRRFDADGTLVGLIARGESTDGDVRSPAGLAVDTAGMLWVADSGHHRVLCFANDGRRQQCWGQFGDGWGDLRYPTDVAVTDDGIVFVADPQHHCVWKFTATGKVLCQITRGDDGLPLLRPGRLTSDGKELFVGDVHSGLVHRYRDVTG